MDYNLETYYFEQVDQALKPDDFRMDFNDTKGDSFDSNDERYMYWWLIAAQKRGWVTTFYQPNTIELLPSIGAYTSRPAKRGDKLVYKKFKLNNRPIKYTPDYGIHFSTEFVSDNPDYFNVVELIPYQDNPIQYEHKGEKALFTVFYSVEYQEFITLIDIKPEVKFARFGASHRDFPIKQSILWHIHSVLVIEFVLFKKKVPILFQELGTPKRYLLTDKSANRTRKLHYSVNKII